MGAVTSYPSPGLGGKPCVVDVGGVPNLIPDPIPDKQYNLNSVARVCDMEGAYVIGPR